MRRCYAKNWAELGVGLAIDDFGTGYSSMRYLKQFPISKLKIDRSFISDLTVSRESREIVSAIIAMASALNISLTAEGVETLEQEAFLAKSFLPSGAGLSLTVLHCGSLSLHNLSCRPKALQFLTH